MKHNDFRKLSGALKTLTPHQRQELMDRLEPAAQNGYSPHVVRMESLAQRSYPR